VREDWKIGNVSGKDARLTQQAGEEREKSRSSESATRLIDARRGAEKKKAGAS